MAKPQPTPEGADRDPPVTPEEYQFGVSAPAGDFRFSVLTVKNLIQLRPKIREFWGAPMPINGTPDGLADLNSSEYSLAAALAEMQLACLEAPDGWTWDGLFDAERAWEVWLAYIKARDTFRESMGVF